MLNTLLNAGINTHDAQTLAEAYAGEPEFLQGLEQVAHRMAGESTSLFPPQGEPWRTIYDELSDDPNSFERSLEQFPSDLQVAISGAVSIRMSQIQQWREQNAGKGKRKKAKEIMATLKNLGYSFRYNLCRQLVEVNEQPITDPQAAEIRSQMRDIGFFEINAIEDAYLAHAWRNRYHPIRDYLTSLSYRGGDVITQLGEHFTDAHGGIFPVLLRRFLIGAVARVMAGEQNRMLILEGEQGLGKDYFAKWLCSPMPDYFLESAILPDDKDHRLRLGHIWIWNVQELGSTTRRSDREALKAFLTLQEIHERKPYGHHDTRGKALSSFVGSVNNESGFLSDPTGHRRFMVVQVKAIDWSYSNMDVDQVWAQAYDLYITGERWQLEDDELARVNQINDSYQIVDIVEETLLRWFEVDRAEDSWWLSTVEIMEVLKDPAKGNLRSGSEVDTRRLSAALTKLGLEKPAPRRIGGNLMRGYYGIRKQPIMFPGQTP